MQSDAEKITASNKTLLITIGVIAGIILGGIFLFIYGIILSGEVHVISVAHPDFESDSIIPRYITSDDFKEHPALEELIVRNKMVFVSHGPFLDTLLHIDPRSRYHTASQDGNTQYSEIRISGDEKDILIHDYYWCEYNGTVYCIAQSA